MCASHHAKLFTPFPHFILTTTLWPFFRWRNWDSEGLSQTASQRWNPPSNRLSPNPRTWKHATILPPVIIMARMLETLPLTGDLEKVMFLNVRFHLMGKTRGPVRGLNQWEEMKGQDFVKLLEGKTDRLWRHMGILLHQTSLFLFHLGHHGDLSVTGHTDPSYWGFFVTA